MLLATGLACRDLDAPPRAAAAQAGESPRQPRAGLIDIGGRSLYLDCQGEQGPTVVMDAGDGQDSRTWRITQPAIASFARVCSYDRAGLGASSASPEPQTSRRVALELRTLLRKAGVPPPYVLVGHSLGGLHVRAYAYKYPDEVAGLVLVDSGHEDQWLKERELAALGVSVPRPSLDVLATLKEIRADRRPLEGLPLVVLTRGNSTSLQRALGATDAQIQALDDMWRGLQKDLLTVSARSRWVIALRSGHFIQLDEPQLVIDAVRSVVDAVRHAKGTSAPVSNIH